MTSPLVYKHTDGITYEGFRPYEGEDDVVNMRRLNGPHRYALVTAICSINKQTHTVWTVIDTQPHITAFQKFISEKIPQVKFIRYLRSRT